MPAGDLKAAATLAPGSPGQGSLAQLVSVASCYHGSNDPEVTAIATETSPDRLVDRVNALREGEPDPFDTRSDAVEAFVLDVAELLDVAADTPYGTLNETQQRYLNEAAMRQVRFARARLDHDRREALETLERLFRLGKVPSPRPDGHHAGELVALSTGLLSDPFFEWLTRIYLPWLGKHFDAAAATGDNVFSDNAWSKATGALGWPEYRVPNEDPPRTVRVFPFRTFVGRGIEDPDLDVLKIHYADSPNPLPVRRIEDELVELPGGYLLGKAHMRGLREFRRVCYFGLLKP